MQPIRAQSPPLDAERAAAIFQREGYVVIDRALPIPFVDELRADLERLLQSKIARYKLRPAPRDERCVANDGVLNAFQPEGGNHDYNRWNMHLPSRAPYFSAELIDNPLITSVIDRLLGRDWIYYIIASDTPFPNSGFQTAHQDYTRFSVAINVPLVDVTLENGPTEVWPGSHQPAASGPDESFHAGPHCLEAAALRRLVDERPSRQLVMSRGSVLIRDHRMVHRGTPNLTDAPRYMLSLYCTRPAPVPHRRLADLGAAAALALRRLGCGGGGAVRHPRLFDLGSVLGRVVEECSSSDRDYRRPLPPELWAHLRPAARHHLRFSRLAGGAQPPAAASLHGCGLLVGSYWGAIADALRRRGGPRLPDRYASTASIASTASSP